MDNLVEISAGGRTYVAAGRGVPLPLGEGGIFSRVALTAGGREFSAPARRSAHCFDPEGVPFVRLTAVFSDADMDGLPVTAAGLLSADGSRTANWTVEGFPVKREGENLTAECTVFVRVAANGVRLTGGDNPLLRWLTGEKRGAEFGLYPAARPGAIVRSCALPKEDLLAASCDFSGGAAVFSGQGLTGAAGAALAVDGVAALVYETPRAAELGEEEAYVTQSDVLVPGGACLDMSLVRATDGQGNAESVVGAEKQSYGRVCRSGEDFPATLYPADMAHMAGAGKRFALFSGSRLELFGDPLFAPPRSLDEGREISAAALAGDWLAVAFRDGEACVYSAETLEKKGAFAAAGAQSLCLSPDGRRAVYATGAGRVTEVTLAEDFSRISSVDYTGGVPVAVTPDGRAYRAEEGEIVEYDYAGGGTRRTIAQEEGIKRLYAFPGVVLAETEGGATVLTDIAGGRQFRFSAADGAVTLSPGGGYLLMRSPYGRAKFFHLNRQTMKPEHIPLVVPAGDPAFPVNGGLLYRAAGRIKMAAVIEDRTEFVLPRGEREGRTYFVRRETKSMADALAFSVGAEI